MINRDYLPYPCAREYVDRGMAKWSGFFLSEHSTALTELPATPPPPAKKHASPLNSEYIL